MKDSDLIRRSDAIDLLELAIDDSWEYDYATDRMYEIPAVDAVEVVRCGQCQFTETDCVDAIYCQRWDRWEMEPDGYCAWGQRREDGGVNDV